MARKKQTGRSKSGGKYVGIGHGMLTSEAFRSLSGGALKYYIELCDRYNGINNGHLHLSPGEASKLLHMSKTTAWRAPLELEKKGLIRKTKDGNWYEKEAAEYALTDRPTHDGKLPTNEWGKWTPKK